MKRIIIIAATTLLITACEQNSEFQKQKSVSDLISEKRGFAFSIAEKIPTLKEHKNFTYTSFDKKSPFEKVMDEQFTKRVKNSVKPDLEREKEFLENFELNELKITGVMKLKDADNKIVVFDGFTNHILGIGNYIGKNFGKIKSIKSNRIIIEEIIKEDGYNSWIKKEVELEFNKELRQ